MCLARSTIGKTTRKNGDFDDHCAACCIDLSPHWRRSHSSKQDNSPVLIDSPIVRPFFVFRAQDDLQLQDAPRCKRRDWQLGPVGRSGGFRSGELCRPRPEARLVCRAWKTLRGVNTAQLLQCCSQGLKKKGDLCHYYSLSSPRKTFLKKHDPPWPESSNLTSFIRKRHCLRWPVIMAERSYHGTAV